MAAKTDENQQENTLNPDTLVDAKPTELDEAKALADVDLILAEDDPDFLKQISDIKVEAMEMNLSIMDDVIRKMSVKKREPIRWRLHIHNISDFRAEPRKFLLFWGLIILCIGLVFYGPRVSKMYFSKGLFLRSFAEWSSNVQPYNPISEVESFYDNPRFAKNLMKLSKIVVNLKPSENSSSSPMLAIEINIEGMSSEAIIEIKDREAEFKDQISRIIEEYSYDELSSVEGKKQLLEKVSSTLNSNITQGQIRRVLLRTFVLKP